MHPILLDRHRNLFKSEDAFAEFVQMLTKQLDNDLSPVISDEKVLGAILSPAATKEFLYERLVQKIAKQPEVLDEIRDRIENDEIVD